MSTSWKTIRVFISSTFRDMQSERDWLVRFVFPRLSEELLKYRIHLVDVDLRWGVTSDQDALGVCREIIDDCRPRFLCILGGRYGWVPGGQDKSITAAEIHYGALDRKTDERGHCFFYFRRDEATALMSEETPGDFREPDGSESARKLEALKQAINAAALPVFTYDARWDAAQKRLTGLEAFGNRVHDDLLGSLKNDPELIVRFTSEGGAQPEEFAEEAEQMEAFIEERADRYFVGSRETLMSEILAFTAADGAPNLFVLTGDPGSGKSALLAKLCRELESLRPSPFTLPHFVGASTGSTNLRRTLRRLCHELACATANTEPLPLDIKELITCFQKLLAEAGAKKRVILVFDALNQFDPTDGAHWLNWLPRDLPSGVRILASVIAPADGQPQHQTLAILRHRPGTRMEKLEPLTEADTLAIIEGILRRYAKRLSPEQLDALLAKPSGRLPLYVLTALEELRTLGTYDEITARIRDLPGDARALFGWILTERLARDPGFRDREGRPYGPALVETFAGCLAVSRHGLSLSELTSLLDPGDPLGNVAALLRLLRPYLMRRGELLDFYHGQFRQAGDRSFLTGERKRCQAHRRLATHFQSDADPENNQSWKGVRSRPFEEIPFHAAFGQMWQSAFDLMTDFLYLETSCAIWIAEHKQPEGTLNNEAPLRLIGDCLRLADVVNAARATCVIPSGGKLETPLVVERHDFRSVLIAIGQSLRESGAHVALRPESLFAELQNRLEWSFVTSAAGKAVLERAIRRHTRPWFRSTDSCFKPHGLIPLAQEESDGFKHESCELLIAGKRGLALLINTDHHKVAGFALPDLRRVDIVITTLPAGVGYGVDPEGHNIYAVTKDADIRCTDVRNGESTTTHAANKGCAKVIAVRFAWTAGCLFLLHIDGSVTRFDIEGQKPEVVVSGSSQGISPLDFDVSPDGNRIIVLRADFSVCYLVPGEGTTRIRSLDVNREEKTTGAICLHPIRPFAVLVVTCRTPPDSRLFVYMNLSETGDARGVRFESYNPSLSRVAFLSEGCGVLLHDYNRLRLHDPFQEKEIWMSTQPGLSALGYDAELGIVVGIDRFTGVLTSWRITSTESDSSQPDRVLARRPHINVTGLPFTGVGYIEQAQQIVTASGEGISFFDASTAVRIRTVRQRTVLGFATSEPASRVVFLTDNDVLGTMHGPSCSLGATLKLKGRIQKAKSDSQLLMLAPDFWTPSDDCQTIIARDLATGCLHCVDCVSGEELLLSEEPRGNVLCFAPDGKTFFLQESNGGIKRIGFPSMIVEATTAIETGKVVSSVVSSVEARMYALEEKHIVCFDLASGEKVWEVREDAVMGKLSMSPDGTVLYLLTSDNVIARSTDDGRLLAVLLTNGVTALNSCVIRKDGHEILIPDGTGRVLRLCLEGLPSDFGSLKGARKEVLLTSIRQAAKSNYHKGYWEAAESHLQKLLSLGEPIVEVAPQIVTCLLNAHEEMLPDDAAKINDLIRRLDRAGHKALAAGLHQQLEIKQPKPKKPWWKFW